MIFTKSKNKYTVINLYCLVVLLFGVQCDGKKKEKIIASKDYRSIKAEDSVINLSNDLFSVSIDANGGAFSELSLKNNPINPLTWASTQEQMPVNNQNGAPFKGHFLCLGRWGSPSEGEKQAGIPHNGEQSNTHWKISQLSDLNIHMNNEAPLDGLTVKREVQLSETESLFLVREFFSNTFSLGRLSNVVQHVTLGPPFLNAQCLINSNAKRGFNQTFSYPDPHELEFEWPMAFLNNKKETIDIRSTAEPSNYCMTYLFDGEDQFGWVTAYDPVSGVVLCYVWNLKDYPWINIWSHFKNGSPVAKGIEFGTTGIGRPYKDLVEIDTRFHGENSWEYIDAGESVEKVFVGFLMDIGKGKENPSVEVTRDGISINGEVELTNPIVE